jgi:carboxymethylenebutenolidase
MGVAYAALLSIWRPEQIAAVVAFYGTLGSATVDFAPGDAPVQGHFAAGDEWEPENDVRAFETSLRDAGRTVEFHHYDGPGHWFIESNQPAYDPAAARLAWDRTLAFLRDTLSVSANTPGPA